MRASDFHIKSHIFIIVRLLSICVRSIDGLEGINIVEGEPVWTVPHNASVSVVKLYKIYVAISFDAVIN
jgi:hypothetical protein